MKSLFRTFLLAPMFMAQPHLATAAINNFFGIDYGVNYTNPRPNSNAAADAFDASATTLSTIDFESLPVGSFISTSIGPAVFAVYGNNGGANPEVSNIPSLNPRGGFNTTAGGAKFLQIVGGTVTFNFSQPIIGFGAFVTGMNANGASYEFNDGAPQSVVFSSLFYPGIFGGSTFVGFISSGVAFSSVTFRTTTELGVSDYVGIDDLRYVVAVPEPAAIGMFCAGLLAIAGASHRNRRTRPIVSD